MATVSLPFNETAARASVPALYPSVPSSNDMVAPLDKGLLVACYYDVSSPEDKAVFFSGGDASRLAADFCRKNKGFKTVCMTEALTAFNELKMFYAKPSIPVREIYDLGDIISERFAKEASGNVTVFAGGKCQPHGTFLRVELPAILANEKIISINNMEKQDFLRTMQYAAVKPRREIGTSQKLSV